MNHKPMQQGMLEKLSRQFPTSTVSIEQHWTLDPLEGYKHSWQLWIEGTTIEYFPKFEQLWNRVNELCKDNEPIVKTISGGLGNINPYEGMKDNYRGD